MKMFIAAALAASLVGCGYSARDTEVVGQVKRVMHNTPLICDDYQDIDLSLGVIRNGTGSASKEDVWIIVSKADADTAKKAAESGQLVKVTYDTKRATWCAYDRVASSIKLIN